MLLRLLLTYLTGLAGLVGRKGGRAPRACVVFWVSFALQPPNEAQEEGGQTSRGGAGGVVDPMHAPRLAPRVASKPAGSPRGWAGCVVVWRRYFASAKPRPEPCAECRRAAACLFAWALLIPACPPPPSRMCPPGGPRSGIRTKLRPCLPAWALGNHNARLAVLQRLAWPGAAHVFVGASQETRMREGKGSFPLVDEAARLGGSERAAGRDCLGRRGVCECARERATFLCPIRRTSLRGERATRRDLEVS